MDFKKAGGWFAKVTAKQGVTLGNLEPEMWLALKVFYDLFEVVGKPLVVTSTDDGIHRTGSLHYVGLACDVRTRQLTAEELQNMVRKARTILGINYDIILEQTHVHIEFDFKLG